MRVALVVLLLAALHPGARADVKRLVLDGRVVTPDGTPAANALVLGTLEWDGGASTFRADPSAADGSFKLDLAPSGSPLRSIRVFAYLEGFSNAAEIRTVPHGSAGYAPVILRLRPTIAFTARVVDGASAPVPTATVTIAKDSFSTSHPLLGVPQHVDATGSVTFSGLNDADSIELDVAAPGYVAVRWPTVQLARPLTIAIARGGRLTARLVDRETGAPIAGCTVQSYAGSVITDATGRFELDAPYGTVLVWPSCAHYGPDHDLVISGIPFAESSAGQLHTLKARRNQVVTVRVVTRTGKPVVGFRVTRVYISHDPNRWLDDGPPMEALVTGATGEVVFDGSSMDEFSLHLETQPPVERHVTYAELRGPITLVVP